MFKEDFVPVLLPMQRALLLIIIKDTLNFMQNITWRQYEFSREKFNREHYIFIWCHRLDFSQTWLNKKLLELRMYNIWKRMSAKY